MTLTPIQTLAMVVIFTLSTVITRFLPFVLFRKDRSNNSFINYLGQVLPYAAIGMLVVYCLRNVDFMSFTYGIPEVISILCIIGLHVWRGNTLLSIGAGTVVYMVLVQVVFV